MKVRGSWKSSLDFACHSAACAPPPVGTGGSTDGGSAAEDYRGYHQPNAEGPRAHNLIEDEMVPGDVYEHPEWYTGYPKAELRETMAQLRAVRGKPDAELTIYRALPAGVKGDKIRPGDWVSLSKSYARQHLDGPLMGEGEIASLKVPAHTVRWAIDDLTEWGYFPNVQASAAEELGCQDASCAPPPVGTGGSKRSYRAQHVAPNSAVESIQQQGFRLTPGWSSRYGSGTYLSHEGDVKSEKFYARQGRGRTKRTSSVIVADVELSNPLHVSGRDAAGVRKDLVAKLGGDAAVAKHFEGVYKDKSAQAHKIVAEELPGTYRSNYKDTPPEHWFFMSEDAGVVQRVFDRFEAAGIDTFQLGLMRNMTTPSGVAKIYNYKSGYADNHSWADPILSDMAKARGHDGLVIEDTHGFTPSVGGSQIVVFDPSTIKVRGVRPVTASVSS